MRWTVVFSLSALFAVSCGGDDATNPTPNQAWVATEPIQCLDNAWEQDWLDANNGDYDGYPKNAAKPGLEPEEFEIIRDYYARQGVTVSEAETAQKFENVCTACVCPEGHTLYLRVRQDDVRQMIAFGYREESPK